MADALERSIRTGAVCRFEPVDVPERWRVRVDQEGGPRRST
jgi:hypothetical protein